MKKTSIATVILTISLLILIVTLPHQTNANWVSDLGDSVVDVVSDGIDLIVEITTTPVDIGVDVIEGSIDTAGALAEGDLEGAVDALGETFSDIRDESMEPISIVVEGVTGEESGRMSNEEALAALGIAGGASLLAAGDESNAEGAEGEEGVTVQKYFGGKLLLNVPCTCEGGASSMLWIYDYVTFLPMLIKDQPGQSHLYPWKNIYTPGVALLGSYTSGGQCVVGITPYCYTFSMSGTIDRNPGAGTSLIPAF